ncbi:MAG: hypothetical protein AB7U20_19070 [Planctomycetaceae bacterium]
MARLPLVRIALVGLGTDWQQRLSPAFEKMHSRVRVVAVFDDVALTALTAAGKWQAEAVLGVRQLLMRQDVDAILLRSAGWQRDWLLDRLRERQLPVLLGPEVVLSRRQLDAWYRSSEDEGVIIIPELRLRYQPATLRLRELQATALGRISRLLIRVSAWRPFLQGTLALTQLLDWSTTLVNATPVEVAPAAPGQRSAGGAAEICITFENVRAAESFPPVELLLVWDEPIPSEPVGQPLGPLCEVTCEHGSAAVLTPHELQWTVGDELRPEKLTSDRSSTEVVLDLFARRVLGGLIPTPDLRDWRRAQDLAEAVQTVQHHGKPIRWHATPGTERADR